MSSKSLRLLSVLAMMCCVLSCTSEKTTQQVGSTLTQQQPHKMVRWFGQWYGEGKKETLVREMSREFAFLNQDLNVDLKFAYQVVGIDSFADPFRKVADSLARWVREDRWPYDLVLCDKWFYADVATALNDPDWGKEYLVDFSKEKWYTDAHKKYVLDVDEYKNNFGGIAPGAFIEGSWNLLFTSSVVEKELGLKVKDYDMTIDDFIEYARVVHAYNQTHTDKITFCATNYVSMETIINQLVLSELGATGNASVTDKIDALEKVYRKLEVLAQYKPDFQYHTYANDRELKHDKTLFHLHSSWVTMFWQRSNPEGEKLMRPCEIPSMTGKTAYAYSGTYNCIFVVPKKAKNRDEAIRLMKFICSLDIAEKWENYSKCPTGLKSRISVTEFGSDNFSLFSQHVTRKFDNRLQDRTLSGIFFGNSQRSVNFNALNVLHGEISASQAVGNIRRQL